MEESKARTAAWIALPLCVLVQGCAVGRGASPHSKAELSLASDSPQADALWQTAQDVLRRHDFVIDRVDRTRGVITTMPSGSQHFFEFWRRDVATGRDFWEASLNPIRRRVEIRLPRDESGAWTGMEVAVYKERLSSLDRQVTSSGSIYQAFGDRLPATTGEARLTPANDRWLDLGRDTAMEDYLRCMILPSVEKSKNQDVETRKQAS